RLIELVWGEPGAPKLTLVGKGVCFDTGGLDIKPSSAMLLMKKDMAGAALMLGLAKAITGLGLSVRLRVLIPAVENAVGGRAFRPGDVLRSRKGLTVEIGNTDAEGRLILADALVEADRERPDLLIDAATLTGAARVALGPELPALFTPDDGLARELLEAGERTAEPLWRLPLHGPYRSYLKSPLADINNTGQKNFAGAITAALFLKEFVVETRAWAHLDIFGWNDESRPGRPRGGEATALRPLLAAIERRFAG
ncbi:MAG: leucyl aminopeptidase family protein, partial [Geminicoccaceae bacterium]|nr:leucyl aminopeptidase family protein [Geminicoccaceae bacterium]